MKCAVHHDLCPPLPVSPSGKHGALGEAGGVWTQDQQIPALHAHSSSESALPRFRHERSKSNFSPRTLHHSFTSLLNVCTGNWGEWDENEKHIISCSQGLEETRSFKLSPVKPCSHLNRRKNRSRCPFLKLFISYLRPEPVTSKRQGSSKQSSKSLSYKGWHH